VEDKVVRYREKVREEEWRQETGSGRIIRGMWWIIVVAGVTEKGLAGYSAIHILNSRKKIQRQYGRGSVWLANLGNSY